MAHKFVPRKGFKKDKEQQPAGDVEKTPGPGGVPAEDPSGPELPPETPVDESAPVEPPVDKPKIRSTKDSILKKLPGKGGPRKASRLEQPTRKRPAEREYAPSGGRGMPMIVLVLISLGAFLLVGGAAALFMLNQVPGYRSVVAVTAPNRLDWTFVEGRRSTDKADPNAPPYDSLKTRYELYVPQNYDARRDGGYPMILFLSSDSRSAGWSACKALCVEHGIIFASPQGAGDDKLLSERTRVALDVLDEVRRNYKIDPDRTYIAGFFGGAREACRIAYALPEMFGGVVAVCGGELIRDETWLRDRMAERLSFAWVTGSRDPQRSELVNLHFPLFEQLHIRTEKWVVEGQGRAMLSPETMAEVFRWLEEGIDARRQLAARFPNARMPGDAAPTRAEAAKALLDEAKQRIAKKETFLSGAAQLNGLTERWGSLPAGREGLVLYQELNTQPDAKDWLEAEERNQRFFDLTLARILTSYLSDHPNFDYQDMSKIAWLSQRNTEWQDLCKNVWRRIRATTKGTPEEEEAKQTLAKIEKGLFVPPAPPPPPGKK